MDESGGEEILYPRHPNGAVPDLPKHSRNFSQSDDNSAKGSPPDPTSPPSAFSPPVRKAKKRTSDEFEMDQSGLLVAKRSSSSSNSLSKERGRDEKPSARKHRSLGLGTPSSTGTREKGKERRRETIGLTISSSLKPAAQVKATPERHTRQTSASSSSSNHADNNHSRRVHTTDFSHLPPSPSSSSIQQFLRHTSSAHTPPPASSSREHLQSHPSPNVAHSLLRGTQEGWSGLDDEATAEALRKLDGLSGKSARARASVGSFGRPGSSRPGTPPSKGGNQWEGVGVESGKVSRRASGNARDSTGSKDKDLAHRQLVGLGLSSGDGLLESADLVGSALGSSDEQQQSGSNAPEKTPKKSGTSSARSSFTPKRGSASSTTYTGTPTTSSRDSASVSTSATSVSAASGRHSIGKTGLARRNSAGSDISSVHSNDATSLKDRVASLAVNGDVPDEALVPPVPPLPKDLSTYRSPPSSSTSLAFPPMANAEDKGKRSSHESDPDRTISLEVPPFTPPPKPSPPLPQAQSNRQSQQPLSGYASVGSGSESAPAVLKTPSKKWSFSNALNIKLSSSPSSGSQKSGFPLSPRSVTFGHQIRKTSSKDQALSPSGSHWSPTNPDAMGSAASLASMSSVGSTRAPKSPSIPSVTTSRTPDAVPSRSGTSSSASTNHTTSALAPQQGPLSPTSSVRRGQSSKRLTPSSIPFFRRSSSQSMQVPPSTTAVSPTLSTGNMSSTTPKFKASNSPQNSHNPPSSSVPGSAQKKSSVLSLGLPSLLKGSSSRRSLHSDSKDAKERQRVHDAEREKEKKTEKERQKKEDKDRSESRISVLMGRKRGKARILFCF